MEAPNKKLVHWVAAIAPWFCLHLPSCGPGFEFQAHHLRFFQFVLKLYREKDENTQKEAGNGPFLKDRVNNKREKSDIATMSTRRVVNLLPTYLSEAISNKNLKKSVAQIQQ